MMGISLTHSLTLPYRVSRCLAHNQLYQSSQLLALPCPLTLLSPSFNLLFHFQGGWRLCAVSPFCLFKSQFYCLIISKYWNHFRYTSDWLVSAYVSWATSPFTSSSGTSGRQDRRLVRSMGFILKKCFILLSFYLK